MTTSRRALPAMLLIAGASIGSAQVRVVDMIPRRMSDETFQNAEPSLAVNPKNPAKMAASSLTPGGDLCSRGTEAPIFVTADSGRRWSIVCKIHVDSSSLVPPGDVTLRWSNDGGALFAALLWPFVPSTLQVFATPDPLTADEFATLHQVRHVDQPDMQIVSVGGKPRMFVAADFFNANHGKDSIGKGTAVVLMAQPYTTTAVDSVLVPVEQRDISDFGPNYAIRLAAHPSGVIYAAFYSPRQANPSAPYVVEDLVVVRDDSAGFGRAPFTSLRDLPVQKADNPCNGRDGLSGFRVARCAIVPYPDYGDVASFGNQRRLSANLSIAVDPRRATTVWVAWADSADTNHYLLHVRQSTNGGRSWTSDVLTIPNATNPALAVASDGTAGFLFQQLQGSGPSQRWVTRLLTSADQFRTRRSYTLSTTPSNVPPPVLQPYIGDYIELRAVGRNFYGVFSAANTPDLANFPNGVVYQRNVDLNRKLLLNAQGAPTIGVSIDPFFFSVGPQENPACRRLRAARDPRANDIGCK